MNIFRLDKNPAVAARAHCDQHVVKMIVEYAQMLSTAHRVIDGVPTTRLSKAGRRLKYWQMADKTLEEKLYKPTHTNHPSNVWVRTTAPNYRWMYKCFEELCKIFRETSGREHATWVKLSDSIKYVPHGIRDIRFSTPLPLCMPDKYHSDSVTESYREFYRKDKSEFATFKRNGVPHWW